MEAAENRARREPAVLSEGMSIVTLPGQEGRRRFRNPWSEAQMGAHTEVCRVTSRLRGLEARFGSVSALPTIGLDKRIGERSGVMSFPAHLSPLIFRLDARSLPELALGITTSHTSSALMVWSSPPPGRNGSFTTPATRHMTRPFWTSARPLPKLLFGKSFLQKPILVSLLRPTQRERQSPLLLKRTNTL